MGIISKMCFEYMAFIFVLVRIQRVWNVNRIQEELYKANSALQDKQANIDAKQHRNFVKVKLDEARMQREERVLTETFVNLVVPLTLFGICANFYPYFIFFIPLDD